jgi:hypothetical protein
MSKCKLAVILFGASVFSFFGSHQSVAACNDILPIGGSIKEQTSKLIDDARSLRVAVSLREVQQLVVNDPCANGGGGGGGTRSKSETLPKIEVEDTPIREQHRIHEFMDQLSREQEKLEKKEQKNPDKVDEIVVPKQQIQLDKKDIELMKKISVYEKTNGFVTNVLKSAAFEPLNTANPIQLLYNVYNLDVPSLVEGMGNFDKAVACSIYGDIEVYLAEQPNSAPFWEKVQGHYQKRCFPNS